VLIRPATPADEPGIRALCRESLSLDPDAAELTGILRASHDRQVALVSEESGRLRGSPAARYGVSPQGPAGTCTCSRSRRRPAALVSAREKQQGEREDDRG